MWSLERALSRLVVLDSKMSPVDEQVEERWAPPRNCEALNYFYNVNQSSWTCLIAQAVWCSSRQSALPCLHCCVAFAALYLAFGEAFLPCHSMWSLCLAVGLQPSGLLPSHQGEQLHTSLPRCNGCMQAVLSGNLQPDAHVWPADTCPAGAGRDPGGAAPAQRQCPIPGGAMLQYISRIGISTSMLSVHV